MRKAGCHPDRLLLAAAVTVLKSSGIEKIADLKGKKVGYSVAGFEDTLLRTLLAEGGLKPEDVETVNVNWSISPSLMSGQVDAVIGGYRNFELHELELAGKPGKAFFLKSMVCLLMMR